LVPIILVCDVIMVPLSISMDRWWLVWLCMDDHILQG